MVAGGSVQGGELSVPRRLCVARAPDHSVGATQIQSAELEDTLDMGRSPSV
jgi:hypothetical protein